MWLGTGATGPRLVHLLPGEIPLALSPCERTEEATDYVPQNRVSSVPGEYRYDPTGFAPLTLQYRQRQPGIVSVFGGLVDGSCSVATLHRLHCSGRHSLPFGYLVGQVREPRVGQLVPQHEGEKPVLIEVLVRRPAGFVRPPSLVRASLHGVDERHSPPNAGERRDLLVVSGPCKVSFPSLLRLGELAR